jgi:hypothetical protein
MKLETFTISGAKGIGTVTRQNAQSVNFAFLPSRDTSLPYQIDVEADIDREPGYDDLVTWFNVARRIAKQVDGIQVSRDVQAINELLESMAKEELS